MGQKLTKTNYCPIKCVTLSCELETLNVTTIVTVNLGQR